MCHAKNNLTNHSAGPARGTLVLTKEMLERGVSYRGGYTKAQTELLGIAWPLKSGWKQSLIGQRVSLDVFEQFVELAVKAPPKNHHNENENAESTLRKKPDWAGFAEPVEIFLYALELEDGCYYVGLTHDVQKRFDEHASGDSGAIWTRLHRPKRIMKSISTGTTDERQALAVENAVTVELMRQYGAEKVRGGCYCYVDQEHVDGLLRAHGHLDGIKLKALEQKNITTELAWDQLLDGFLSAVLAYYDSGCPMVKVDGLYAKAYALTTHKFWHEDFSPGLNWAFWGKGGILHVLLSIKLGRPVASGHASVFDVLASAVVRGKKNGFPYRRLFLHFWDIYKPDASQKQLSTFNRWLASDVDEELQDYQYDEFVTILFPEARVVFRRNSAAYC